MSKHKLPENRRELHFLIEQTMKKIQRYDKDSVTPEFIDSAAFEIIEQIPASAFEPVQPVDEGVLFYHGQVDEDAVVDFQHDLLRAHLNLPKAMPITLNLSSVGGSVFAGLALISTIYEIQRAGRKVNVHVQGVAMSMGSVIAQVADRRTIEPSAFFMLHGVQYRMSGFTDDHEEEGMFSKKLQDALYLHYSARTGKPVSYYQDKLKRRNWYMSADEALTEGLVDAVVPAPCYTIPQQEATKPVRATRKTARDVTPRATKVGY